MMKNILFSFRRKSIFIYLNGKTFPVLIYPVKQLFFHSFLTQIRDGQTQLPHVKINILDQLQPDDIPQSNQNKYLFLQEDGTISQQLPEKNCVILAKSTQKINDREILGIKTTFEFWFEFFCKLMLAYNCILAFKLLHCDSRVENKHLEKQRRKK